MVGLGPSLVSLCWLLLALGQPRQFSAQKIGNDVAKLPQRPKGEFLAGTFILSQKSLDEAPYRCD